MKMSYPALEVLDVGQQSPVDLLAREARDRHELAAPVVSQRFLLILLLRMAPSAGRDQGGERAQRGRDEAGLEAKRNSYLPYLSVGSIGPDP